MIIDTSALISALFPDQRRHEKCAAVLRAAGRRVMSPFVLAEVDYLVRRHAGVETELSLLDEVAGGAYEIPHFSEDQIAEAAGVIEQYSDLAIYLTDASLVVLAAQMGTRDLFTLDERHFRALAAGDGKPFRLLPADV